MLVVIYKRHNVREIYTRMHLRLSRKYFFPGEDPRTPLPIRRKVKIGPATPLNCTSVISFKTNLDNLWRDKRYDMSEVY